MKFGLLGTGYWAAETHGAGLAAHPDVDFIGVWGRDETKTQALADRYDVAPYADVDALLTDVDAVAVALPPDVQAPLAVRAAEAGKHLLLDKPLALTVDDASRVVSAVNKSDVASVVFFTRRFSDPIINSLNELSAAGPWSGSDVVMYASIFREGSPYAESTWRQQYGALWDIGPHVLSVLLPVLGPVDTVTSVTGPHHSSHLFLSHTNGAVSRVSLSLAAPPAMISNHTTFYGPAGFVPLQTPVGDPPLEQFARAIDDLLTSAHTTRRHPCDVHFAADVVNILTTAQTSTTSRRGVSISLAST